MEKVGLVGGDHAHVAGLSQVRRGLDIRYHAASLMPVFERMIAERAYEACEFSLANYLMLKDRGADWIAALPVFPQRAFRHANIYVRADSPFRDPSQLRGARVGVPEYSMTLAVWLRGILGEQYGVHWSEMRWVASQRQRFSTLANVEVQLVDEDLEDALLEGGLDVLIAPRTRSPTLRRLIADPKAAEQAYLQKTGVFPINHVIVMREDLLARVPDAPGVLYEAYCESLAASSAPDAVEYGMTATNLRVIRKLCDYLLDQKLIRRIPDIESLFLAHATH